jgi:predicted permease
MSILRRITNLFRRSMLDREIDAELRSHIEMRTADNLAAGMPPQEARRQALLRFGNRTVLKERVTAADAQLFLDSLWQDLHYAFRMLRKSRGFAAVAILTLALGIGANTAIFSMVNALLLHPYDFPHLDRLVKVWEDRGVDEGYDSRYIASADADDLRAAPGIFEGLTTYSFRSFNLGQSGDVQHVLGCAVSPEFFDVLRVHPALGRPFAQNEDQPGLEHEVIVSHAFWEAHLGGTVAALGKTLQLDGRAYTVVGVMPVGFDYPVPVELWTPLALTPAARADRTDLSLNALGRLKHGVSVAQARVALQELSRRWSQLYPRSNSGRRATALELRKELYAYTLPLFGLLQAAAAFVLLLACANLANLLFARSIGRQRELAIRIAVGANHRRLAQLFVCETTMLALLAGVVAVAASVWSVRALRTSISPQWTKWVPGWNGIRVDHNVLVVAVLVALLTGILFGLAIVFHGRRLELSRTLKEGARGSATKEKQRLRSALVVAQVALALVLLVCAGLTIQGFRSLADVYNRFQPQSILQAEVSLPKQLYSDNTKIASFYREMLRAALALPGVESAALTDNPPASNLDNAETLFTIQGRPAIARADTPSAGLQVASPDYFLTMQTALVAGRDFTDGDDATSQPVAIISDSMAKQFWPASDAVGQRIKLAANDSPAAWLTIVGVAKDLRQNWWDPPAAPLIYQPFAQAPERGMFLVMRTRANPVSYAAAIRDAVRRIDPQIALTGVNTMESSIGDSIGIIRIMGTLMGIFGFLALGLSSIGVYGVLSESVAQRTQEIGIRLALGAHPRSILRLILGHAVRLTAIGLAIGLPIAVGISYAMANAVFGLVSVSAAVLAGFALLLVLMAVAAGYIPARRAMKVDPMVALRYE